MARNVRVTYIRVYRRVVRRNATVVLFERTRSYDLRVLSKVNTGKNVVDGTTKKRGQVVRKRKTFS